MCKWTRCFLKITIYACKSPSESSEHFTSLPLTHAVGSLCHACHIQPDCKTQGAEGMSPFLSYNATEWLEGWRGDNISLPSVWPINKASPWWKIDLRHCLFWNCQVHIYFKLVLGNGVLLPVGFFSNWKYGLSPNKYDHVITLQEISGCQFSFGGVA